MRGGERKQARKQAAFEEDNRDIRIEQAYDRNDPVFHMQDRECDTSLLSFLARHDIKHYTIPQGKEHANRQNIHAFIQFLKLETEDEA